LCVIRGIEAEVNVGLERVRALRQAALSDAFGREQSGLGRA
jgi:hypothetical protein